MGEPFDATQYLQAHEALARRLDTQSLSRAAALIDDTLRAGRQVITCGNGGSAATASHYVTDWQKSGVLAHGRPYRALSLVDNIGLVTAWANDVGYDEIFAGQVRAIASPGDLLVAVSGSGNSPNVLKAVEAAHDCGVDTLAVVGYDGGRLKPLARHCVWIPSFDMQLCEDLHLMFGHMVMKRLCGAGIGRLA